MKIKMYLNTFWLSSIVNVMNYIWQLTSYIHLVYIYTKCK